MAADTCYYRLIMKLNTSASYDLINLTAFVLCAIVLLPLCNGDLLYMAQERSLFMNGSIFWHECIRNVGGGTVWIGRFLTQLFYYPWLGSMMLIVLWAATYLLLSRTFPLPQRFRWLLLLPITALLVSVIDLGYWIYYIKLPGYWFRESLGLFFCSLLIAYRKQHPILKWIPYLLSVACYPLIGWYSVLALLVIAIDDLLAKRWLQLVIALVLLLVAPPVLARCYTTMPDGEAWIAAFPAIGSFFVFSWVRTMPFIIMAVMMAIFPIIRHYCSQSQPNLTGQSKYKNWAFPLAGIACMVCWSFCANFSDHNYHAEMRAYRAIEEQRWSDVLHEVDKTPNGPTRQLVVSKNIALLHADHLHDLLYAFPCLGANPAATDSLPVHMVQTAAPLFYLYHGMTNDATHWCIENSVEYGLTVSDLRILSLASLIAEEYDVAAKYLNMLAGTSFHRNFARRYLPLTQHPDWIGEYTELTKMKALHEDIGQYINSDKGNCEKQIYETFANQAHHSQPIGLEAAMAYSLMLKDYDLIWHHLPAYARQLNKKKMQMPRQYQEAIYLGTQMEGTPYSASEFRFDADIPQRFQFFFSQKKPKDDHTYWWFFQYCTNVQFY